jgi:nucleotide-binding universal stress UspA family protein
MGWTNSEHGPRPDRDQRRVVAGFDDSAVAVRALGWAVREAARRGTVLEVVVAWQPMSRVNRPYGSDSEKVRSAVLTRDAVRLAHRMDPAVRVTASCHKGSAGKVLVHRSRGADVVVLGTHSHLGIVGAVVGSTARYVVRHSSVPVVLLGSHAAVTPEERVVLVVTDSEVSPAVLVWVADRVRHSTAALHVVDAGPGGTAPRHDELLAELHRMLPATSISDELVPAGAGEAIGKATAHDLAVLALDHTSEHLALRPAACAVVLVPARRATALTTRRTPSQVGATP